MIGATFAFIVTPAHAQTTSPSPSTAESSSAASTTSPSPEPTTSPSPSPTPTPTPEAPVDPQPTDPEPTDPKPTDPKPTDPTPTEPAPAEPDTVVPERESPGPGSPDNLGPLTDDGMLATAAAPTIRFADVSSRVGTPAYSEFSSEIAWLANRGVSEGWLRADGSREFRPYATVSRDAMAAFLYRFADSPAHVSPTRSPFVDVRTGNTEFYREITWAADAGISTGWKVSGGSAYRPFNAITREAMAAFLYRYAGSPRVSLPSKSPFKDVPASSQFYKAVVWLETTGAANGWTTSGGAEFRPRAHITRDAIAAFIHRLDEVGVTFTPADNSAPLLRHSVMYVYGAATLNLRSGPTTSHPVRTTRSRGAALTTTGVVSPGGWIEVLVGGQRLWGSGYYLIGYNGAAITRAKTSYSNGRIPVSDLCSLSWDKTEILLCEAADDLERLNRAFKARYGRNIPVNDTYRDYAGQVRAKQLYGNLAATPGTSNHGWAAAVDIGGSSLPGGYGGAQYLWLRQQLAGYNWVLPTWARPGGTKPEAWHFEYTG